MNDKPLSRPAAAVLVVLGCLLASCDSGPASPEDRVRAAIAAIEQAIEDGSVTDAAEWVHREYTDDFHPNRAAAMRTLLGLTRRHSPRYLFTKTESVKVSASGERAEAVAYVAMTAVPVDSADALFPLKADLYRFDIAFARVEGDWRVLTSRWAPAELAAF